MRLINYFGKIFLNFKKAQQMTISGIFLFLQIQIDKCIIILEKRIFDAQIVWETSHKIVCFCKNCGSKMNAISQFYNICRKIYRAMHNNTYCGKISFGTYGEMPSLLAAFLSQSSYYSWHWTSHTHHLSAGSTGSIWRTCTSNQIYSLAHKVQLEYDKLVEKQDG